MEANTFLGWLGAFLVGCRRCWIVLVPLFVLDALGGSVLAKKTTFQALPELGGQSSGAYSVARYPASDRVMVVGHAVDAAGVSRAVTWELLFDGEWSLEVLPSLDPNQTSYVMGIEPSPFKPNPGFRAVVGASRDISLVTRAILWERNEPGGPWNLIVLPGPNGRAFGAGAAANAVGHPPTSGRTTSVHTVVGWSENEVGTPKAVVWQIGKGGEFEGLQLPDLAHSEPSWGNALTYDALGRRVVVGSAVNESHEQRPVVWREGRFFEPFDPPTELPLCPGCTVGEITAVGVPPSPVNEWSLVGWGEDPLGNRRALLWHTDDDGKTYTLHDLGVPAGFLTSEGHGTFQNNVSLVVGQACNSSAEAWLWSVNEKVTDQPLSASVVDLPANVTLRSAAGIGPFENIVGTYTTTLNGSPSPGGDSGQHAFVLTPVVEEIPTLSEWAMGVMTLLLLSVGTLVVGRRRMVRAPAA